MPSGGRRLETRSGHVPEARSGRTPTLAGCGSRRKTRIHHSVQGTMKNRFLRIWLWEPVLGTDPWVRVWLWLVLAALLDLFAIGAITRLTDSGLSMVEWRPLMGVFPPFSDSEWRRVFELYQATSQHILSYGGAMTLSEFKFIFFWEWLHRLWARGLGLAFFLPMVWFLWQRRLSFKAWSPHGLGLLGLGGLQGLIGWWMVQSGFADRVSVSHGRLAIHFGLALLVLGWLFMLVSTPISVSGVSTPGVSTPVSTPGGQGAYRWCRVHRGVSGLETTLFAVFMFCLLLSGALVAGLKAGLLHQTWPLMGGQIVPPDYFSAPQNSLQDGFRGGFWYNALHSPAAVQFHHRVLAYGAVAWGLWLAWRTRGPAARLLGGLLCLQLCVGILNIVLSVPLVLAVLHQLLGCLLLLGALNLGIANAVARAGHAATNQSRLESARLESARLESVE